MKKENKTDVRGFIAEERLVRLARSLREKGIVKSVRRAGRKLDMHGVDIIIFVTSLVGKRDIKVPVQVKSSFAGIRDYYKKHPTCVEAGVLIIVVNDAYSDKHLSSLLQERLEDIQWCNHTFETFFESVRSDC